jgi:diacylglycerol kinase family enzyme
MELDGKPYEANNNFISICNSKYTGGEMMMAPRAQVDDGKLDVVMLNDAGRLKLLNSFPKIFKGTHIDVKEITYLTGKTLEIKSPAGLSILADGEILGKTPLKARVLPKKLSVLI